MSPRDQYLLHNLAQLLRFISSIKFFSTYNFLCFLQKSFSRSRPNSVKLLNIACCWSGTFAFSSSLAFSSVWLFIARRRALGASFSFGFSFHCSFSSSGPVPSFGPLVPHLLPTEHLAPRSLQVLGPHTCIHTHTHTS